MYKILVVDDEKLICKAIKSMLERLENPLIAEVLTANSAREAEAVMLNSRPDIVITDICMPLVSGLDLIKSTMRSNTDVKFIVLSGYDEFQYAKEAIKLGVVDYLLKPATIDELKEVLNKTIELIKKHQVAERSEIKDQKYEQAVVENNLNKVFANQQVHEERIREILEELKTSFPYNHFSIAIYRFDGNSGKGDGGHQQNEFAEHLIKKMNEVITGKTGVRVFYFYDFNNNLVMLFNIDDTGKYSWLMELMYEGYEAYREKTGTASFLSTGGIAQGVASLPELYRNAVSALSYRIVLENSRIIEYEKIKARSREFVLTDIQLSQFSENLRGGRLDKTSDFIDSTFNKDAVGNKSIKSVEGVYRSILAAISRSFHRFDFSQSRADYTDFYTFNTLSDLRIYLKDLIFKLTKSEKENESEKSVVDVAKKYIQENYYKDIDMTIVANMVSMSYTYFSKIFKEQTGMNFIDYLMKVRMETAERLLSDPTNKINEISSKVGYDNPKHFTRAFRNYFGISPKEYRDRNSSE